MMASGNVAISLSQECPVVLDKPHKDQSSDSHDLDNTLSNGSAHSVQLAGDTSTSEKNELPLTATLQQNKPQSLFGRRFEVKPAYDFVMNETAENLMRNSLIFNIETKPTENMHSQDLTTIQSSEQSTSQADQFSNKKRVRFPAGQALIKGFAHAPNPWYNVSQCSTENLVTAYNDSCKTHGVRPISKLVSQLKVVKDFGERVNVLTLKGENLNAKHIETLEEIFRRVQFNTLDLESTHLDDESAISVFEMVEYYESAIHLKISLNKNLGMRAWLACSKMIRKTPCLESLDIRGCSLNEQCVALIGRALRMGSFVSVLHMEECNLACRGVMILCAAVRTISTIKELYLGENNLQPSDGIQLGNLIRNNTFIHTLDVKNNHLQDMGIAHICDGLAEQPNNLGLRTLILSNNHISHHCMSALSNALSKTKSLTSINLSQNYITNEGIFLLKDGLLKNKSLAKLSLKATKLSCEGAVALAEYIADSYTIAQLDMRENDIKTAGLLALSMCIRVHQTVTRLELDQTVKKEQAVKDYQSQQRFFLDEIQTQLSRNTELARAKLEKLLDQSASQTSRSRASSVTDKSKDNGGPESVDANRPEEDLSPPEVLPSVPLNSPVDDNKYFDPLGAVSLSESSISDSLVKDATPEQDKTRETFSFVMKVGLKEDTSDNFGDKENGSQVSLNSLNSETSADITEKLDSPNITSPALLQEDTQQNSDRESFDDNLENERLEHCTNTTSPEIDDSSPENCNSGIQSENIRHSESTEIDSQTVAGLTEELVEMIAETKVGQSDTPEQVKTDQDTQEQSRTEQDTPEQARTEQATDATHDTIGSSITSMLDLGLGSLPSKNDENTIGPELIADVPIDNHSDTPVSGVLETRTECNADDSCKQHNRNHIVEKLTINSSDSHHQGAENDIASQCDMMIEVLSKDVKACTSISDVNEASSALSGDTVVAADPLIGICDSTNSNSVSKLSDLAQSLVDDLGLPRQQVLQTQTQLDPASDDLHIGMTNPASDDLDHVMADPHIINESDTVAPNTCELTVSQDVLSLKELASNYLNASGQPPYADSNYVQSTDLEKEDGQ